MTLATDGSPKVSSERRSDELVATASSKEEAEALRRVVIKGGTRLWVFVYPHKNGKYSITAANEWGGSLPVSVVVKLKADCDAYIVSTLEELDIDDIVEDDPIPPTDRDLSLIS